jgi:Flp pilus assembly pilin Flp
MRGVRIVLKDKSVSTAVEYGLIAAGISLAIIAATSSIGTIVVNLIARSAM